MAEHEPQPDDGGLLPTEADPAHAGSRRRRRRASGCIPVLLVLLVVGGLFAFGVIKGVGFVKDQFRHPDDYAGPGKGSVQFEVRGGDSLSTMGGNLADKGVVASAEAFTDAASGDPKATGIQAGFYDLKKKMKASDVVTILVDPGNIVSNTITFPEGLRVDDIVDLLVKETDFKRTAFEKALDDPQALGLPDYAKGNAEGYLFPATYAFGPNEKPKSMLRDMVARWKQAATDSDLEGAAKDLGYTPHELMTVASLVQAEGRGDDMAKIARVIYNRLENVGTAGTVGLLQIDATVNFALGRNLGVAISEEDLQVDSPYNTRLNPGLPPGPIESPGDDAIAAASHPAEGDWYYYVTVNLETGETKFAETPEEFDQYKGEFLKYCETSDAC